MGADNNRQKPQKSGPSFRQRFSLIVWLLVVSFVVYFAYSKHTQAITNAREATIAEAAKKSEAEAQFATQVQQIIDNNADATYSVSAVDIKTGASVKVGSGDAMNAASCAKVLTAVLFLHEVENGQASLTDQLGGKSSQYQLKQLINQSDDNAWVLFNDRLTHSALLSYARQLGLTSYDPSDDTISTQDMSSLLLKLYKGQLLGSRHTNLLLSYMQNTNYEQFIVPAIPPSDSVYHKVGFVDGEINDAAIISNGKSAVALSIFSNGSDMSDQYTRAQTIQEITKAALNLL